MISAKTCGVLVVLTCFPLKRGAFCLLLRWGGKKFLFGGHFCAGEATNFCLLLAFALGNEQIFVCCLLSHWGSSKFLFAVHFCVGEAKNFCLLLTFALGNEQIFVRSPLLRRSGQRHFAVWGKRGGAGAVVRGRCGRCRILCGG